MIEPTGGEPLGSAARALLEAAREGLAPDAAAVRRMRAKVGASAAAGAGTALAIKLGLAGVVAALAIGAGIYASRDRAPETPAIALREGTSSVGHDGASSGAREGTPVAREGTTSTPAGTAAPAPAEPAAIEMAPQAARPRTAPHAEPAEPVDLAREVALIDAAMTALRAGDPTAALDAIHTHARETHGAGQLAEDAAAIEVEALCRLHDPAVGAKLDAFDVRFPRSAQRSRLTKVCK